jgi:hypothetical protein
LIKDNAFLESKLNFIMDEYTISKLMRKSIELMKKGELSEFICRDLTMIKYGFDYNILN